MLSVLLAGCAAQDDSIERKCERLRDHMIDLRMEGVPKADQLAHRSALAQALGEQFTGECKTLTVAQIDCGLAANDITVAAACSSASSR